MKNSNPIAEKKTQLQLECEKRGIRRLCCYLPIEELSRLYERGGIDPEMLTPVLGERIFRDTKNRLHTKLTKYVTCWLEYPLTWICQKKIGHQQQEQWRTIYQFGWDDEEVEFYEETGILPFTHNPIHWDWVVLLIDPHYIWKNGTLFCPGNAVQKKGQDVNPGLGGFQQLYLERPATAYFQADPSRKRPDTQLASTPTDSEAEVLIPGRIAREDIREVVFCTRDAFCAALRSLGISQEKAEAMAAKMEPMRGEKRGPEHQRPLLDLIASVNSSFFYDSLRKKIDLGDSRYIE